MNRQPILILVIALGILLAAYEPGGTGWTVEGDGINYFLEPLK
jgi:hypothetical protein